eukprot:847936-Prymnesium_polylepis.1
MASAPRPTRSAARSASRGAVTRRTCSSSRPRRCHASALRSPLAAPPPVSYTHLTLPTICSV